MAFFELDERGRGLDRVLAFSDGVFAIAITLLVLAFRVPILHGPNLNHRLLDALLHQGSLLIGFAVSFFVIARLWMSHHRLSLLLRRVDTQFIAVNFLFLAFVVFLPFPAEVVGLYGKTTTGVVFYAATMCVTLTMSAVVWTYAFRHHLVDERVGSDALRQTWLRSGFPVVVFAISIPVSIFVTANAEVVWVLLATQHWVLPHIGGRDPVAIPTDPSPRG
jgi:uncharacterized membrane protein